MTFPVDPPWPSQVFAALSLVAFVLLFAWLFFFGGARRHFPAVRRVAFDEADGIGPALAISGGGAWMLLVAGGTFLVVQLATDALREVASHGVDVWWAAGRPDDFPTPPEQGIGLLGWAGMVVVLLAAVWGLAYVLHGFQRHGSGRRAVRIGALRLAGVTLVLAAYGGLLWWEVARQRQEWASWIEVFSG